MCKNAVHHQLQCDRGMAGNADAYIMAHARHQYQHQSQHQQRVRLLPAHNNMRTATTHCTRRRTAWPVSMPGLCSHPLLASTCLSLVQYKLATCRCNYCNTSSTSILVKCPTLPMMYCTDPAAGMQQQQPAVHVRKQHATTTLELVHGPAARMTQCTCALPSQPLAPALLTRPSMHLHHTPKQMQMHAALQQTTTT